MALSDLTREILVEFKADVSDIKSQIKELEGVERELAQAQLEQADARNEQLDAWIEKLAKVTLAVGAFKELGEIVWDGWKESVQEARLATAAHGVDIEKLGEAAHGLKTNMELLEFAAKANSTTWKNSQGDMEIAMQAMHALEARGISTEQATTAVTNAVIGLKTKGLQALGIEIDTHVPKVDEWGNKLDDLSVKTEQHTKIVEGLEQFVKSAGDAHEVAGEQMQQAAVKAENSWADLKKALGQLAESFKPILAAIAQIASYAASIIPRGGPDAKEVFDEGFGHAGDTSWFGSAVYASENLTTFGLYGRREERKANAATLEGLEAATSASTSDYDARQRADEVWRQSGGPAQVAAQMALLKNMVDDVQQFAHIDIDTNKITNKQAKTPDRWDPEELEDLRRAWKRSDEEEKEEERQSYLPGSLALKATQSQVRHEGANVDADVKKAEESLRSLLKAIEPDLKAQQAGFGAGAAEQTFLQKTFGKISDFDLYKEAFKALEGGVSSALKAWIDGSENAGQAFQKFIGKAVEGLAIQMGVESIKHLAYSLGSLAFGDPAGAAAHALASADRKSVV